MTNRMKGLFRASMILAIGCSWQAHAGPLMALTPSGNVSGVPGATVGWGFTITNDTGFYLLPFGSFFCQSGQDPLFTTCTTSASVGSYTDLITSNAFANDVPIPPAGLSESFDSVLVTGVGAYAINLGASAFAMDSGNLIIEYSEYDSDPLTNPSAIQENAAGGPQGNGVFELSAPASVTVTSSAPEPATMLLVGSLLFATLLYKHTEGRSGIKRSDLSGK